MNASYYLSEEWSKKVNHAAFKGKSQKVASYICHNEFKKTKLPQVFSPLSEYYFDMSN